MPETMVAIANTDAIDIWVLWTIRDGKAGVEKEPCKTPTADPGPL